jgi:UDP-N-acetylmuramate--alanine ligase
VRKDNIYHFIGIGGVSMSALAMILKNNGKIVQGSDNAKSFYTNQLKGNGIKVFFGHRAENIENANIVVYTNAIKESNPELARAKELNLPIFSRAQILESITKEYDNVIAISGSHGKTTTTGMIAEIFHTAGFEPTIHIGGKSKKFQSNFVIGKNKFFITEACEYKNNFHFLKPSVGVILNLEKEHMDFFKTYENLHSSFATFAKNCENLVLFDKVDIKHKNTLKFGESGYSAKNIKQHRDGTHSFVCYLNKKRLFKVRLNAIGRHNIYNALAAIAVSRFYLIPHKIIKQALKNFQGISRRFDIKKQKPLIIHDYAHHPSEIRFSIASVRAFVKGKLIVMFQPHTYSRTKEFMQDFKAAFDLANQVCIIKTYSAREHYVKAASAKALFNCIKERKQDVCYFSSFAQAEEFIKTKITPSDAVLILGAGNIDKLADKF